MRRARRLEIIGRKGQVELVVAKIVFFFAALQPGQFQLMRGNPVSQEHQRKAAVFGFYPAGLGKAQGFLIEFQAFIQVQHVEIIMREGKLH